MANYYVGDTIRDYFTVVDTNDIPIPGLNITMITALANGQPYFYGSTEVGGGTYYVEFTPSESGNYYYLLSVDSDPVQYFENNFDVDGPVSSETIGQIGGEGATLLDLVGEVATEVGDLLTLVTTASGSPDGSSFTDAIRGSGMPAESLKGANVFSVNPDSGLFWEESRINSYDNTTFVFTVQPAFTQQVASGDTLWVTNRFSRGYWRQQYIDSINASIRKLGGANDVPVVYTLNNYYYDDFVSLARPSNLTKIYGVNIYLYDEAQPYQVPMSPQNRSDKYGWHYDFATGRININDTWYHPNDVTGVRILGFGHESKLVNPTDMTRMSESAIIPDAAARLLRGKGDPRLLANAAQLQNIADQWLGSAQVQYPPGTISIG
jgi:hypothetical protein